MPLAEKAVEKFIRNLGQSKPEQKPVCPYVVEVRAADMGPCESNTPDAPMAREEPEPGRGQ